MAATLVWRFGLIGVLRSAAQDISEEQARTCWDDPTGVFTPALCCHPRFGKDGFHECWDGIFNAKLCCNETLWPPTLALLFHHALQASWAERCGRKDLDDKGIPWHWKDGIGWELMFFFMYLRAGVHSSNQVHAAEIAGALNPEMPLKQRLVELLVRDALGRSGEAPRSARILDIGAGPMSQVGYIWPGIDVQVVVADALACEYDQIRLDIGLAIPPQAVPRVATSETLVEIFGEGAFDIVHCSNSLDHAYDPLLGVEQMLRVVKLGRPVLLQHSVNEGEKNEYAGLHQWNFEVQDGRFIIWRPADEKRAIVAERMDVVSHLDAKGLIAVDGIEFRYMNDPYGKPGWVEFVLWRRTTL